MILILVVVPDSATGWHDPGSPWLHLDRLSVLGLDQLLQSLAHLSGDPAALDGGDPSEAHSLPLH